MLHFEEDKRIQKQVMKLYYQAFSKMQDELTHRGQELEKLISESVELEALCAQKEEELTNLRAGSERALQERADLIEQIRQKDTLVGQLREDVVAKDAEILELARLTDVVASERDALREKLSLIQDLLRGSQEEVVALSAAKSGADEFVSSYKRDVSATNDRAREISEKAELKMARAVAHARLKARRQAFEEASTKGFDLSTEIEEVRALEEESAISTTSDEGSESSSGSSEGGE